MIKSHLLSWRTLLVAALAIGLLASPAHAARPQAMYDDQDSGQQALSLPVTPWLDMKASGGIVYLLYAWPSRIDRYDASAHAWLAPISLPTVPTAMALDEAAIYVSFHDQVDRFNLDGTGQTPLYTATDSVTQLEVAENVLYLLLPWTGLHSVHKSTGALIDLAPYAMQGLSLAPNAGLAFAGTNGISPSDILRIVTNADGTFGALSESPYHGAFPTASQTFVLPGDTQVAGDSGIVYNTADLTYSNSLAGAFDDIAFHGTRPIVLREGKLIAMSEALLETGQYDPGKPLLSIHVEGDDIVGFYEAETGVEAVIVPVTLLQPITPGTPVDPNGLAYMPDAIQIGQDEIVYLLDNETRSIFRWSVPLRSYLETIPLVGQVSYMAYSGASNTLYLAYELGKVTYIDLDDGPDQVPLFNVAQRPGGLATAGDYIFVYDGSGAWGSHWTYSPDGELISWVDWNHYSREYTWSATNRRMYFFRDNISPNDLHWEEIDINGEIGAGGDSPYHGEVACDTPIRVAPNGSVVVLGSGQVFDANNLALLYQLPNPIADAAWGGGFLFTLEAAQGASAIAKWGVSPQPLTTRLLPGAPLRSFTINEGLLIISVQLRRPWFSIWDLDLGEIYQLPVYVQHLPLIVKLLP